MSSTRKEQINPYFFFLAKRLIQVYYFGFRNPSDLQLVKVIYDINKSLKYSETTYIDNTSKKIKIGGITTIEKVKLDPYAKSIARRIHKLLKAQSLCFTKKALNYLIDEIKYPKKISSWDDFVENFKEDRGALEADLLCNGKDYFDLDPKQQKIIQDAVEYKCYKVEVRDQVFGYQDSRHGYCISGNAIVIANNDSYTIRTPIGYEVSCIPTIKNNLREYEKKKRIDELINWRQVNPNILFLYLDEPCIGGYIVLLPITEEWLADLFLNEKYKKPILKSDIIPRDESHLITNILIESIEGSTSRAKALLKFYLPLILEQFMNENQQEFNLILITNENDADGLLKYGFIDFGVAQGDSPHDTKTIYIAKGRTIINILKG